MRKQGFSKSRRMTERREFVRLFDHPLVFKTRTFQVFYKTNDRKSSRLGITIKGRLSSVWRTRIKRVLREWFRTNEHISEIKPADYNIVIHVPKEMNYEFLDLLRVQIKKFHATGFK